MNHMLLLGTLVLSLLIGFLNSLNTFYSYLAVPVGIIIAAIFLWRRETKETPVEFVLDIIIAVFGFAIGTFFANLI
ncbi:hypothetical protein [Listeria sp. PSOL-1]|uniref:hypothetical protein n=1 Tax=Listeria sp. PSOL-1 TaxID=1844999 RepID=UPI0013D0E923|nr:hypothetical protein [Listeria sp. PSOL-1]